MKNIIFFCITLILVTGLNADVVNPGNEIKFYLQVDKTLNIDQDLEKSVKDFFAINDQIDMVMKFLDSSFKEMHSKRWITRVRNKSDKNIPEITYKYRIPITGTLQEALEEAERLGWDSTEVKYKYEVDWGYAKKTFSISKKKKLEKIVATGAPKLPSNDQSRKLVVKEMPGKLKKWGKIHYGIEDWAKNILKESHVYGPVKGKRHIGYLELAGHELEINIEVWNIAKETIVELSFKVDSYPDAGKLHKAMKELLENKGWLLKKDILKTRMILDSY